MFWLEIRDEYKFPHHALCITKAFLEKFKAEEKNFHSKHAGKEALTVNIFLSICFSMGCYTMQVLFIHALAFIVVQFNEALNKSQDEPNFCP